MVGGRGANSMTARAARLTMSPCGDGEAMAAHVSVFGGHGLGTPSRCPAQARSGRKT